MPNGVLEARRAWNRNWMRERREAWFAANGPCKRCGSSDRLELDHIDRSTKVTHAVWSWAEVRREAELAKCQVLCYACHKKKTSAERPAAQHGTSSKYRRGCRCSRCTLSKCNEKRFERRLIPYPISWGLFPSINDEPSRWANPARTVIGAGESSREPADAAPTSLEAL